MFAHYIEICYNISTAFNASHEGREELSLRFCRTKLFLTDIHRESDWEEEKMNNENKKYRGLSTRKLVVSAMLSAVSIVLGMTPLGIIPLPIANLTTMHIPTILAGILEGPVVGMWVGLIFGLTSLYKAISTPTSLLSPFLMNPLVSIVPRMLIGVVSWAVYEGIKRLIARKSKQEGKGRVKGAIASGAAAFFGTMTNTVGVLGMVWVLYAEQYAAAAGIDPSKIGTAIWGICVSNGLLEAAAAMIIVIALERVLSPLVQSLKNRR